MENLKGRDIIQCILIAVISFHLLTSIVNGEVRSPSEYGADYIVRNKSPILFHLVWGFYLALDYILIRSFINHRPLFDLEVEKREAQQQALAEAKVTEKKLSEL